MRRWAALLAAVGLTGGCALGTGDDRSRAEELAAQYFPGQLKVVGARNLFPETTGSEITFALTGDPDAVVRLRVDAEKGLCNGKSCEVELRTVMERGKQKAQTWRELAGALRGCGHQPIGANEGLGEVWIEGEPANATIGGLMAELGDCLPDRSITVNFAAPAVAAKRPKVDPKLPTLLQLTGSKTLAALSAKTYLAASFAQRDAATRKRESSARLVRPFEEREEFRKRVEAAAGAWLAANRPGDTIGRGMSLWRLRPGTVDRLVGFVLFCNGKVQECLGTSENAVLMTVDRQGNPVGEMRAVENVRNAQGRLELPYPV
ncbi:SCO7460 family lipoprotein [Nonomuraea typhae]|uniref:SCO7460 family lipoprotein n=1 Tax=Nonomuraea typhae TaxID=2603600 RepID=A0ABW7ZBA6_9ACTN